MNAASVAPVDWALLAVLVLSVLVGLWRGLLFEVLSLLGWFAAYVGAQMLVPTLSEYIPIGTPGSALNVGSAFALGFVGVLVAWTIAARVLRLVVHATPLTLIDRALGAVFGLLRGGVLLLAVATVVAMTPASRSAAWRESIGASWLDAGLRGLAPWLPAELARYLPGTPAGRAS